VAVREITSASVEQAVHVLKAIKPIDHMPHFSHALMALEVQEMDPITLGPKPHLYSTTPRPKREKKHTKPDFGGYRGACDMSSTNQSATIITVHSFIYSPNALSLWLNFEE
jgi:hypothetical protein